MLALSAAGCGSGHDEAHGAGRPKVAETPATPRTLSAVYAKAKAGAVIRLAAGDYGEFDGGPRASGGAGAPVVVRGPVSGTATMSLRLTGRQNLVLDHLRIPEAYLDGARDVTIRRSAFTGMTRVDATERRAGILFQGNSFGPVDPCAECFEGRLTIKGDGHPDGVPVGVTIAGNRFGPGGTADGIQVIGTPYGLRIGPGNRFTGLTQSSAQGAVHTDPIQLYGSSHTVITGNFLHGNATGIMAPDGTDHDIITNNVIDTPGYAWPIVLGGAVGTVVRHNTLPGGAIEVGVDNHGKPSRDVVVRDNVARAVVDAKNGPGDVAVQDHNLLAAGHRGPLDHRGRPRFSGGRTPRSYAGYRLARSSAGRRGASDGRDVGIETR
ncbi:MAG TPA: hypothetical protein VFG42_15765 [Baekduia sp.]|uniref:hypothetical protein n=1 Tax=Baekduia sp. TaxID=2600305 RepID=UPI002D773E09|nr:hypothetical protein [Baekduia sp.]HET6508249.1 hypothetical protein [Baekduia sp.]